MNHKPPSKRCTVCYGTDPKCMNCTAVYHCFDNHHHLCPGRLNDQWDCSCPCHLPVPDPTDVAMAMLDTITWVGP